MQDTVAWTTAYPASVAAELPPAPVPLAVVAQPADSLPAPTPEPVSFGGSVRLGLVSAGVATTIVALLAALTSAVSTSAALMVPVGLEVPLLLSVVGFCLIVLVVVVYLVAGTVARGRQINIPGLILGLLLGGYLWFLSFFYMLDWLMRSKKRKAELLD